MGKLILVLGGARSGKSRFAQKLAGEIGGEDVLYVATAQAGDGEMEQRIQQHRRERPASWDTVEAPRHVGRAIQSQPRQPAVRLLDCLTLLVSNLLIEFEDPFGPEAEAALVDEIDELATTAQQTSGATIIVSNEVGMGLVPAYPLGRAYRDALGKANQTLAAKADKVYFLVAGLPIRLKGN